MKKTGLIELAINEAVEIEDINGDVVRGYLVRSILKQTWYKLLPFDYSTGVIYAYDKVNSIKHIKLLNNGYKLW